MTVICRHCLIIAACLLASACTREPTLHRHTVFVFGTLVEITLTGIPAEKAEATALELEGHFIDWHERWSPWLDSDLGRVNAAIREGRPFTVPESLLPLIEQSRLYYAQSEGLFNPAIGELIRLWQFHRHDEPGIRPPEAAKITSLLQHRPAITDLVQENGITRSENPHVDLNFGAFAKGYALERAMAMLAANDVENAIVNAGGDLAVAGSNHDRPWRIGIYHPRDSGAIASLSVQSGESVFTSGDYERFYIYEGERYSHILDPRTGYPARGVQSVTVIDEDAGRADAAATALIVAGVDDWHRIARRMSLRYVMLIDAGGRVHMNPAMAERVVFEVRPIPPIVLSEPL